MSPADRETMIQGAHASGVENNKFHLECAEALRSESSNTLTVVLAAALGAVGYAADKLSENSFSTGGATLAVSVQLMGIAFLLVRNCLSASPIYPSHNEPRRMVQEAFTWTQVLDAEIDHLEDSIAFNRARNTRVGQWLNGLRYASFTAPLTWVAVWALL